MNAQIQQINADIGALARFGMDEELGTDFARFHTLEMALRNAKTVDEVLAVDDALREFRLDLHTEVNVRTARLKKRLTYMRNWSQDIWDSALQNAVDTMLENNVNRDSLSFWVTEYIQSDLHVRTISSELATLEESDSLLYTPEQIKAMVKVSAAAQDARDILLNITKPAQAKKLYDKLTKKVAVDSALTDDFMEIYNDSSYDPQDKVLELERPLDRIIDDYESKELYRVTDGRSKIVSALDVENSLYDIEAKQDINAFVRFMREAFTHEEASQMRYDIPHFNDWWYNTRQKLMERGIKDPKPLEQYELLELPSDIPLVRNEVECK